MRKVSKLNGDVLVVKVGTDTLTEHHALNKRVMVEIARQIADIRDQGKRVILVSSGAIGSSYALMPDSAIARIRDKKQALSALGQTRLMNRWIACFEPYDIHCAQMLVQDQNFKSPGERSSLRERLRDFHEIEDASGEGVIPIFNGNDPVTYGPIKTDNDMIAAEVASLAGAKELVFLTNVDGVFTGHPDIESSRLIRDICICDEDVMRYMSDERSQNGTGGMQSKCRSAVQYLAEGCDCNVFIGNGRVRNAIHRLLSKEIGTWMHR